MVGENTENEIFSLSLPLKCSDNMLGGGGGGGFVVVVATNHSGRSNMASQ